MTLQLDNSPPTAGTRRLLVGLAAVAGLICGLGGTGAALAQGQRTPEAPRVARSAINPAPPAAPTPPPPPSLLAHKVYGLAATGPSTYVFQGNENGREIELRLQDDQVVVAKVDGKEIPSDRIVRENDTIKLKDKDGNVLYEHNVLRPAATMRYSVSLDPLSHTLPGTNGRRAWRNTIPGPDDQVLVETEPPKVMLGVTMLEPDPSLRGHLGLEPGTTTLVGSVYEGLPAGQAGLEPYDIIIAMDGKKPADTETLREALREKNPGDEVRFTIIHRGKEREATVKLEKYDRARFDEKKVKAISALSNQVDPAQWERIMAQGTPGGMVGVAPDPNNPAATFFITPTPSMNQSDIQRALEQARARMEEQLARTQALQDRLLDKSSQAKGMEERMRRLEQLLERLLDERDAGDEDGDGEDGGSRGRGGQGGKGGAGTEPLPEDLRPAKGIWAGRNPAA